MLFFVENLGREKGWGKRTVFFLRGCQHKPTPFSTYLYICRVCTNVKKESYGCDPKISAKPNIRTVGSMYDKVGCSSTAGLTDCLIHFAV